jgi:hypothetical protein
MKRVRAVSLTCLLAAIIFVAGATVMESASKSAPKGDIRLDPRARAVTQWTNLRLPIRLAALQKEFNNLRYPAKYYEGGAKKIPEVARNCANQAYSAQYQTAAGCTEDDTVGQCREKLLKHCVGAWHGHIPAVHDLVSTHEIKLFSAKVATKARHLSRQLNRYANEAEKFSNSLP